MKDLEMKVTLKKSGEEKNKRKRERHCSWQGKKIKKFTKSFKKLKRKKDNKERRK